MAGISRRKISAYVADGLLAGKGEVIQELAAYLVDEGKAKDAELYVRSIESTLLSRGVAVADIITARELTTEMQQAIEQLIGRETGAEKVELRSRVEPALLGGFRLDPPDARLDASVKHSLDTLRTSKV